MPVVNGSLNGQWLILVVAIAVVVVVVVVNGRKSDHSRKNLFPDATLSTPERG